MKPIVIAILAVFGGIWAYSTGASDSKTLAQYRDEGETVTGEIQSGEVEKGVGRRSSDQYILKVGYTTLQERLFNKKFKVTKSFFESVGKNGFITQPNVEVVYLKDSPELKWLGPLLSFAGLAYIGYRIKKTTEDDNYDHG